MRVFSLLILGLLALPVSAQIPGGAPDPDPSPDKESFVVMPSTVARGAMNVEIRLVNNTPAGYSHSSSRAPELIVGAGATLVVGSFAILNTNEAKAILNIEQDTASSISLKINIYAVNGTTVLNTFQATLGVTGTMAVSSSSASIGADDVKLVVIDSEDEQSAGDISITGAISGTVSITAPSGTTFASIPSATSGVADINSPALAENKTVFNFSIGNSGGGNITVTISDILYNTQFFNLIGGVEGDLALEITGGALSNQSALVVNAFTAKSTIEGNNDTADPTEEPPAPNTNSEESESSAPTGATNNSSRNSGTGNRRSLSSSNGNNRSNRNSKSSGRPNSSAPRPAPNVGRQPNRPTSTRTVNRGGRNVPRIGGKPVGGGAGSIAAGGAGNTGGDGTVEHAQADTAEEAVRNKLKVEKVRKLVTAPGLYFTNKHFEPVTAVVMNRFVKNEAGGRIWVVLKKEKNDDAKIETLKVKLTIGGSSREIKLTETSKDSGVFHSNAEGVLVVTNEDPDSNREAAREKEPRRRFVR
ncbi:MAG: hypothetical protein L3J82_04825 [Planctomycetes bacterium]|nr:hypothetical protein [Planctomycetota bacterium]